MPQAVSAKKKSFGQGRGEGGGRGGEGEKTGKEGGRVKDTRTKGDGERTGESLALKLNEERCISTDTRAGVFECSAGPTQSCVW